ncbi:unnamed protein product [Zymoseptoria tritici ST99CH_1E4]|uniref:Fork-head domain-containing protein n=2 Tax=Zymoseptoria tritici TaxID=1047171 RepID=A0A2H1FJG1_ZYMTR|nr:unnamed protein product [Zymoseptoria tritici ST99CH_1E4]
MQTTSWPLMDHGDMTNVASDPDVTESSNGLRHASRSNDHDWDNFIKSYPHNSLDLSINNTLGLLGLESNMATQFGDIDDVLQANPPSTTSSGHPSSDHSTNGLPFVHQSWPVVSSSPPPMISYDQQPQATLGSWMPSQGYQQHQQPQQMYDQPTQPSEDHMSLFIPNTTEDYYDQRPFYYQDVPADRMAPTSHPVYTADPMQLSVDGQYQQESIEGPSHPCGDFNDYLNQSNIFHHNQQQFYDNDSESFDTGEETTDPCYAQLLHRCLKEAPDHTLSLKEVYEWVLQHSQKARNKDRGWQNSVRHNLSMNAAFQKVPGVKKGSLWRLTDDALKRGVISTTRYRKDPKRKIERRSATPAPKRQESGRKGGRATRDATRMRQQHRNAHSVPAPYRRSERNYNGQTYSPYSAHSNSASPAMQSSSPHTSSPYVVGLDEPASYPVAMSVGQTPPTQMQVMYDNQSKAPAPMQSYEFLPIDYSHGGFFGTSDPELGGHLDPNTPTPSLMTEGSWPMDDGMPGLMQSRETTTFL